MSRKVAKPKPIEPASAAEALNVPLSALDISPINPRQFHDADDIVLLADSIRVCGLLQNLAALKVGDQLHVVAGGRRLRALRLLQEQGHAVGLIPVLATEDEGLARRWAMAENTARADLNPADEVQAYAAMAREGIAAPRIAAAFGVTESRVAQRLRLAALGSRALAALRDGEINLSQAGALTLCQSEQQIDDALALATERSFSAGDLRAAITGERVRASHDRRLLFVGLQTYLDAGGAVTRDLFSDEVLIEDVALLEELFAQRAEAARDAFLSEGWCWVELLQETWLPWNAGERLKRIWPQRSSDDEDQERAFSAAQRSVAGGYMCVGPNGKISTVFAFVRPEDVQRAIDAGVLDVPSAPTSPEEGEDVGAGFSAAVLEDLRALRLHAVQSALLDRPDDGLKIATYALSGFAGRAQSILAAQIGKPNIAPSQPEGFTPDQRLVGEEAAQEGFEEFAQRGVEERDAALLAALVRGLNYGFRSYGPINASFLDLEREAGADMRRHWTPTKSNFFSRVTGAYLDQVYRDIFALHPSDTDARAFGKMKKGEKANLLHMLFNSPEVDLRPYRLMSDAALARLRSWLPAFE